MNISIIYHSADFDGFTSAYILKDYHKEDNVKLYGHNYGLSTEWVNEIKNQDIVYLADISFNKSHSEIIQLSKSNEKIIYIDHHKSAIEEYTELFKTLDNSIMFCEVGKAACRLCFEYLYPNTELPLIYEYLSDYDVFNIKDNWNSEVMPFQYGLQSLCKTFEEFSYRLDSIRYDESLYIDDIIYKGLSILDFLYIQNEKILNNYFIHYLYGYKVVCVNNPINSSLVFKSNKEECDIHCVYHYNGNTKSYHYSLYSNKVDVSEIAISLGGGGHKCASGFESKGNIFKI